MLIAIIADQKTSYNVWFFHLINIKGAYKQKYDQYSSKMDSWVTSFDMQYRIFDLLSLYIVWNITVAYRK